MKHPNVTLVNATKKQRIPRKMILRLADLIFEGERKRISVNIVMIGDKRMKSLNSRFRGVDSVTDVLSFCLDDEYEQQSSVSGEIYISVPQAKRQAKSSRHELDDEILFLVSHGLLHLLGYTHASRRSFDRMLDRQIQYLNSLYSQL